MSRLKLKFILSCALAGLLATMALLHGDRAQAFLDEEGVRYWMLQ